jgi:DNA-binding SARP family transcriptional activator
MEFRVLGPVEVADGDRVSVISSPRQRALLALLLVHANRTISVDRILDELWDGAAPESGRDAVTFHVVRLRKALAPTAGGHAGPVHTRDGGYALEVGPEAIDAGRFERLAADGHARLADDPVAAIEALTEALELWRGDPYEGAPNTPSVADEIRRLSELRLRAIEDRFEAALALGQHTSVFVELEALVDREPFRERLRALLMTALYRSGRQADALRVYSDTRRILAVELGIDPSPELQALEAAILRQDPGLLASPAAIGPSANRPLRNPYKGLRPFGEADAADFFGREALTARLVERLAEEARGSGLLAIVGPSGSGKSSVVRAGLVPAVRAGAVDGSARWPVAVMLPGSRPFDELATALQSAGGETGTGAGVPSTAGLADDRAVLAGAIESLVPKGGRLLLVIDQLEELWTLAHDEVTPTAFIETLGAALASTAGRLVVVATLRVDHLEAALRSPALGPLVRNGTELVPPLDQDELARAIERPAARAGMSLDPGLVDTILADIGDRPAMLPLLEYALTELAERAGDRRLTRSGYEAIGGVLGALARRAETTYDALEPGAREAARQVFLDLAAVERAGEAGVRRIPASRFDERPDERAVVERFGRARLLALGRDARTGEATVEIAHEALIARWPRLAGWVDQERDAMWMRRRLGDAANEWLEHDRDPGFLLSGSRRELFAHWAATTDLHLGAGDRELLAASLDEQRRLEAAEAARLAKERRLEQRGTRWLRALVVASAIAVPLLSGLLALAWRQSEAAAEQQAIATARELAVAANGSLEGEPGLALLLAAESARATVDRGWITEESVEALHWAIQAARVPYPIEAVPTAIRPAPDGPRGLYLLPGAELIELARTAAGRSLTPDECRTWLHVERCPDGSSTRPERELAVMTAGGLRSMGELATPGIEGTTTRLWSQLPLDLGALLTGYAREGEAGLVTTSGDIAADPLTAIRQADVAILARPADVAVLARQGLVLDLRNVLTREEIASIAEDPLADLGWAGDGAIGATTSGGRLAGVPIAASASSLLWYPADAFRKAGYEPPETMSELDDLVARIVADGGTPWCVGLLRGEADGASGADWVEDLIIDESGPATAAIAAAPWQPLLGPRVNRALRRFHASLWAEGAVLGGPGSAARTPQEWAATQMGTKAAPACWLIHASADERTRWINPQRQDLTPIRLPIGDGVTVRGRVYTLVVLRDRPEVRALVRHLLTTEFASHLAATDPEIGVLPLGPSGRSAWSASAEASVRAQLIAAIAGGTFWPDASDRMSPTIGRSALPAAVLRIAQALPQTLPWVISLELEQLDSASSAAP